jgi:uncharacterized protein YecT (DUF1311 family)
MTGKRRIVGMSVCVMLAVIIIGWIIYGQPVRQVPYYPPNDPSNAPSPQAVPAIPVSAPQPIAAQTTAPDIVTAPAAPTHNYAMEEDGQYGYEGALSENDKNAGRAVNPVVMVRYLGEKDGTYVIQIGEGYRSETMSCKAPCNFIKIIDTYAGQIIKTETVHTTGYSVMDSVFQDVQYGYLKVFGSQTLMPPAAQAAPADAVPPVAPQPIQSSSVQPSFDCNKARSPSETLICGDQQLSALDNELAAIYERAKVAAADKAELKNQAVSAWNWREQNCTDKSCILGWYGNRKRDLLVTINQTPGPQPDYLRPIPTTNGGSL